MLKAIAFIFGVAMIVAGILGFIPEATPSGFLLGLFHVNLTHNLIHLITGVLAVGAAFSGKNSAQLFFRLFGLIYGAVAILGFYNGDQPIFGLIANNFADTILHPVIAVIALYLGFCSCCCCRKDTCGTDKK